MKIVPKILCTGNPSKFGIPNSVQKSFPETTFISLSNGYDLVTDEGQDKFKKIIKNYNVFINVAQLSNGSQEKLLRIAHEEGMKGYIFNIGSIAEYKKWEWSDPAYTAEKRNLKEASLELCSEEFKTTHMIVGGFRDSSSAHPERMDPEEIISAIKFILNSSANIPLIGIEKIKDSEVREQLSRRTNYGKL